MDIESMEESPEIKLIKKLRKSRSSFKFKLPPAAFNPNHDDQKNYTIDIAKGSIKSTRRSQTGYEKLEDFINPQGSELLQNIADMNA